MLRRRERRGLMRPREDPIVRVYKGSSLNQGGPFYKGAVVYW